MGEVISVINQKGGVGKTTTVMALANGLKQKGFNVLVVDLDGQCNLSKTYQASTNGTTSLEMMTESAAAAEAVQHTELGDIIPGNKGLTAIDRLMTGRSNPAGALLYSLKRIIDQYDFIILDTPPYLGTITTNALTASSSVIIPARADRYSLDGIADLLQTIKTIKAHTNSNLHIDGIVITQYKPRTILSKEILATLQATAQKLGATLYTPVRDSNPVQEAQAYKTSLFTFAPRCTASQDYRTVINEFLNKRGISNGQ